jgi:hypothetical protein
MELAKVLALLREELDSLNTAIATLERLQEGNRRRGRPPRLVSSHPSRSVKLTCNQPARTERHHP